MNYAQLVDIIRLKKSFLCVGLDTDITKIPKHLLDFDDPVYEFNKAIINATHQFALAYKPNIAFYESRGPQGWQSLIRTMEHLESLRDGLFLIADAKRGDIGNTSAQYARTFFDKSSSNLDFDAITVAPYMGEDSVSPFLEYKGKWTILLALTSNKGAADFQFLTDAKGKLFEQVLLKSSTWGTKDNMMYVVGATQASMLGQIRKIVPEHFLLVPGVGAQGGSLEEVANFGMTKDCGLIVNASRNILYASAGTDFADAARHEARKLQAEMAKLLSDFQKD